MTWQRTSLDALTETRETVEALTVSGPLQTREKHFDSLESVKSHKEVYVDDLPVETHIVSGIWMDTMMTPKVLRSTYTWRVHSASYSDKTGVAVTTTDKVFTMLLARCLYRSFHNERESTAMCTIIW